MSNPAPATPLETQCREVRHGSPDYQRTLVLRQEVLRAPLGLALAEMDLAAELGHLHFALFADDDTLLACVIAVPLAPGHAKIRQMAVATVWQGHGLGRCLLLATERALAQRGFQHLEMHARVSALGFYAKLGYQVEGPEFIEVTLPHRRMTKALATA